MTIRDLFRYPTIQELSGHITPLASQVDQGPAEGEADLARFSEDFSDRFMLSLPLQPVRHTFQ